MSLNTLHDKFCNRFRVIDKLLKYIKKNNLLKKKDINTLKKIIDANKMEYDLNVISFVIEYSSLDNHDQIKKNTLLEQYNTYLNISNIDPTVTAQIKLLRIMLIENEIESNQKINKYFKQCEKSVQEIRSQKIDLEICQTCNQKKEMFPHASELRCSECAVIDRLTGTEFEDNAITDPNKQKKGDYDPSRFVEIWLDRIQAKGNANFVDKKTGKKLAIIAILQQIEEDGIRNPNLVTCPYIRKVWKLKGFTKHNDDAAYARKEITKISPPTFSIRDKNFVLKMVIRIMKIFNIIKDADRSNSLYYAYVIYKVIKQFYQARPEIRLLESIHIQKDDTLVYNDQQYKKICEMHNIKFKPKLIYEPTVADRLVY